ncbi:MAG: CapA family protein [Pseudobdellovibrio sp.]
MKLFIVTFIFSSISLAQVTLTMGGDVNFNKNLMKADPSGFLSNKGTISWSTYTKALEPLLDGDINFANVETVISDNISLQPQEKAYVFMTHPEAVKHLVDIGFNLMNLANNHAYDFGLEGIQETIKNTKNIQVQNPNVNFVGLGYKNEELQPLIFKKNGFTFAIASLSILDSRFKATDSQPGLIHIRDQQQFRELVKNMKMVSAHYKILSIHNGTESQVELDAGQKAYYEYAIKNGDVDLIIGHHPHSVRPIEKIGDKYIFYSLGNYLMLGSANITGLSNGLDFGLFSKLYLVVNEKGRLVPEAIELVPLTNTHAIVKPMEMKLAQQRLSAFQQLSSEQLGADAMEFKINSVGRGIFCLPELKLDSSVKACLR